MTILERDPENLGNRVINLRRANPVADKTMDSVDMTVKDRGKHCRQINRTLNHRCVVDSNHTYILPAGARSASAKAPSPRSLNEASQGRERIAGNNTPIGVAHPSRPTCRRRESAVSGLGRTRSPAPARGT